MTEWMALIQANWDRLVVGGRICAPYWYPNPVDAGFSRPWITEDRGQLVDWTLSMSDGSRIHVHEYPDGGFVVHRDEIDPARGILPAGWHLLTETRAGSLVLKAAAIATGIYLGGRLGAFIGGT